jgi:hypothetical protein
MSDNVDGHKNIHQLPDPAGRDDLKKPQGGLSCPPFNRGRKEGWDKAHIHWQELSWKERTAYYKLFFAKHLTETKSCLPYMWRLLRMIYCVSPRGGLAILAMNILKGLLPAIIMETKGNFITMVPNICYSIHSSYKEHWRVEL